MKLKLNGAKILICLLFILISLLISAVGLKLNLSEYVYKVVFFVGLVGAVFSLLFLIIGAIIPLFLKPQNVKPSKLRKYFNDLFKLADENQDKFIDKVKKSNFFVYLHFFVVTFFGVWFYACSSFCFLIKPILFLLLPFILIAITPLWRVLYYFLKSEQKQFDDGIIKEDYPNIFGFFEEQVKRFFGDEFTLILDFDKADIISAERFGKTIIVNMSSYVFMLLSKDEIIAVLKREFFKIKDVKYNKIKRLVLSRDIFSNGVKIGLFFRLYFSLTIYKTANVFSYEKRALLRILDRRADELIKEKDFCVNYLTAYKKQCIFDAYTEDSRSSIGLKICSSDENIKEMVIVVFDNFLNLYELYGKEWENQTEVRLKPTVTDRLTYKEKSQIFGINPKIERVENFAGAEELALYDKYNQDYYESAKFVYEPQRQAYENFYNETQRYEQNPEQYDERLKLIGVAHAYYTLAKFDKAEEVYRKILDGGDSSSETLFDYGCFLLVAKRDSKGVEYIYKAMENENLVEDGLEILGKYFISSGDEEGYNKYCEYKNNRLDELVGDFSNRILNDGEKLSKPTIDGVVLQEIVEKLVKDDNITQIYCANAKTKAGKDILLFAISMRNKTQSAFMETYERVFSILDNDYGKIDSFLLSLDLEPKNKISIKIKNDGEFKIFDRKDL
ncbi:MAG: hypothetical protein IJC87_04045 [Clostridia bacterium]|nr:hypothetical protein [Clostridia bacterium]